MKKIIFSFLLLINIVVNSFATIVVGNWNKPVSPVMVDYVKRLILTAENKNASLIILSLDTPGGLETSMREVIKLMNNTKIPFVVFVYPSGARAASAGAIITISADIAAMAPLTNIGSASPVSVQGKDIDKTMRKKIINDMVAFVKAIAKEKGRNEKIVVKMITQAINLSADEALKKKVIDVIAKDLNELVSKIDGKKIKKLGKTITIKSKNQSMEKVDLTFREKILTILANPTIAYILLMIGFYGIFFELYNPGSVVPGTIGAISFILALYALNMISVNWLGVLLIGLGVIFFILEMITPTFGALGFSGFIAMLFGSVILFSPESPYGDISMKVILPVVFFSAVFFFVVAYLGVKAQRMKPETGTDAMIGKIGEALTDINPEGKVMVMGEIWEAYSKHTIKKGEKVQVVAVEGLKLKVKRAKH